MVNSGLVTRLESLKEKIHQAFMAYVTHATAVLAREQHAKTPVGEGPVMLVQPDSSYTLRSLVAQAEDSPRFKDLISVLNVPKSRH